ncbi:MAG: NUDIX domain-containing protein [Burkholderiales bacterium]
MTADFSEKKISSREVYRGDFLCVNHDVVSLPDGSHATREYILHPGAALILPVFDDGSVLLERQYRYPVKQHCYELPAGKIDAGEPVLETAKRELREETGYIAQDWRALCTMLPGVGYSNERIHLFLARDLRFEGTQLDVGEFIETLRLSLGECLDWVRDGRINDTKTMLGLLWAEKIVRNGW